MRPFGVDPTAVELFAIKIEQIPTEIIAVAANGIEANGRMMGRGTGFPQIADNGAAGRAVEKGATDIGANLLEARRWLAGRGIVTDRQPVTAKAAAVGQWP